MTKKKKKILKERLFGFKMNVANNLEQNLHDFLRMMIELANSGENEAFSDENQAIILLNFLPDTYKEVKSAIKYGRTSITLEETVCFKVKGIGVKNNKVVFIFIQRRKLLP